MSILSPGTRCTGCALIDFLPITCPRCSLPYCAQHIHSHVCTASSQDDPSKDEDVAVGRLGRGKMSCEMRECERESIESVAGLASGSGSGMGEGEEVKIAREVRCSGCGGAFCVLHRAQTSHTCPAPLVHNERHDAFLTRRERAQQVIGQHFPEHKGKVVPKPPPAREIVRKRPSSPERLPPSLQQPTASGSDSSIATSSRGDGSSSITTVRKTKAEKMWEIHVRKIRMGAQPLIPGGGGAGTDTEKRFFEWGTDLDRSRVEGWKTQGQKWVAKLDRVWVGVDTPVGKVMDLIIAQAKVARPKSDDPTQTLGLVCLHAPPDGERIVVSLDLSRPAGEAIVEGSIMILVRGK
ncbi:hypothetical protein IAR55_005416 [Kwoniella newhampshirensis]|uniref:AN1-type domain-containing protein n=1 Tax=Kwoniella newhampshirensis TaxID=1651941 RepID=A0AAW0YW60_9TREE